MRRMAHILSLQEVSVSTVGNQECNSLLQTVRNRLQQGAMLASVLLFAVPLASAASFRVVVPLDRTEQERAVAEMLVEEATRRTLGEPAARVETGQVVLRHFERETVVLAKRTAISSLLPADLFAI